MKPGLKRAFKLELEYGQELYCLGDYDQAFKHFERAHILGQYFIVPHTQSHWWMLKIGLKRKDFKEIVGQLIRIPGGIVGSAIGVLPTGNTGGANISAFKKLPVPDDLKKLLD